MDNYHRLSKEQRIQWKKYLCMLGIAFLVFLFLINLLHSCGNREEVLPGQEETVPQHIPVVQELKNIWIQRQKGRICCRHRSRCRNSWQM